MHARDQSSIFSTGGKFRQLHALTLVARSYALLVQNIGTGPFSVEVDLCSKIRQGTMYVRKCC